MNPTVFMHMLSKKDIWDAIGLSQNQWYDFTTFFSLHSITLWTDTLLVSTFVCCTVYQPRETIQIFRLNISLALAGQQLISTVGCCSKNSSFDNKDNNQCWLTAVRHGTMLSQVETSDNCLQGVTQKSMVPLVSDTMHQSSTCSWNIKLFNCP